MRCRNEDKNNRWEKVPRSEISPVGRVFAAENARGRVKVNRLRDSLGSSGSPSGVRVPSPGCSSHEFSSYSKIRSGGSIVVR